MTQDFVWAGGSYLRICPSEGSCRHLKNGDRDYKSWGYYAEYARWGDQIVDLGAHVGDEVGILARLVGPLGRIHAFEPDPTHFQLLRENYLLGEYANRNNPHRNISVYQEAAVDQGGAFVMSGGCGGGKVGVPKEEPPETPRVVGVVLDDKFTEIQGLKMDIEGEELRVLRGMARLLKTLRWAVIECHGSEEHIPFLTTLGFHHKQATQAYRFDAFWQNFEEG